MLGPGYCETIARLVVLFVGIENAAVCVPSAWLPCCDAMTITTYHRQLESGPDQSTDGGPWQIGPCNSANWTRCNRHHWRYIANDASLVDFDCTHCHAVLSFGDARSLEPGEGSPAVDSWAIRWTCLPAPVTVAVVVAAVIVS